MIDERENAVISTPKKRSRRVRYAAMIVVTGFVLVVLWLLQLQNAPAKAIIRHGTSTNSIHKEVESHLVPYTENPYINYSYWSNYRISSKDLEGPSVLSRAEFLVNSPFKQLEVYTEKAPGGFSNESSVHYRQLYKNLYEQQSITVNGTPALSFIRRDQGFERVTFILKGDIISIVSVTSQDTSVRTQDEYQKVLESVRWR